MAGTGRILEAGDSKVTVHVTGKYFLTKCWVMLLSGEWRPMFYSVLTFLPGVLSSSYPPMPLFWESGDQVRKDHRATPSPFWKELVFPLEANFLFDY